MYALLIDILLLLLFLQTVIRASKRGFVHTVAGVLSSVGACIAAWMFRFALTAPLRQYVFEPYISGVINRLLASAADGVNTSLEAAAEAVSQAMSSVSLAAQRLGLQVSLPNFDSAADTDALFVMADSAGADVSAMIAERLSGIAAFLILFAVSYLLLRFLFKTLDLIMRLPILRSANHLLGFVCGFVLGAVGVFLAAQLLSVVLGLLVTNGTLPAEVLDSKLLGLLCGLRLN